jgi:hypothetical protein
MNSKGVEKMIHIEFLSKKAVPTSLGTAFNLL